MSTKAELIAENDQLREALKRIAVLGMNYGASNGGLLEWDMWARIDRSRPARPHKYASIGPQIRLSRVAIGLPPRHQQTTAKRSTLEHSLLEIEATARDALGQRHHLTALGYGPRAAALKKTV